MVSRGGRRRGITLIELLVSVVILGVTAPGLLLASGTSARLGMTAQKRATAQALAVQQLELFRYQCRASTLSAGTVTGSYAALKLGTFSVRRDVTLSGGAGTCEVLVSWSDTRGNGVFTDSLQLGTVGRVGS